MRYRMELFDSHRKNEKNWGELITHKYSETEEWAACLLQQIKKSLSTNVADRIRRIHMFLGLPDPDPLVRDTDPTPDLSIITQKY